MCATQQPAGLARVHPHLLPDSLKHGSDVVTYRLQLLRRDLDLSQVILISARRWVDGGLAHLAVHLESCMGQVVQHLLDRPCQVARALVKADDVVEPEARHLMPSLSRQRRRGGLMNLMKA